MPPNDHVGEALVQDQPAPASLSPPSAPIQTESPPTLKILILEDDPNDAELMQRELRKAGLDFAARRVATRADFVAALETFAPDLVLADYQLPDFNGDEALAHVRQVHPEIPVVMVTGTLGEEAAVELLKAGAKDYVLKRSLLRLPSAVERAIAVEQGIRARKSAEAALRASNALLQATERIAHIGGFDWDIASGRIVWSEETYRIFGRSPGQFVPTRANFIDCVHPDDRGPVQEAIDASVTRNEPYDIEFRTLRPDRAERIIHTRGEVIRDAAGKPLHMTGTSYDITERKQADVALRKSRQLIEGILNTIPVRVFWKDKNLVYLGCNAGFARDAGFGLPEEIVGKDDYQMGWRDQAELYRSDDREVIESGRSKLLIEEPSTTPKGETITLLTSKIPLHSANGEIEGVLGTYQDITERKRAEAQIRENEAKFRSLVEQNVAGIFIIREDGTIGYVNPFFARLLGYAASDLIGHPLLDFIPADSKADAPEKLGAQVSGDLGLLQQNSGMQTRDGRTIEVLVNASRSIFEGRPASLAVILDVTERNTAQRELASTAAILATEHEVSPDGIVVVDPQRSIISTNRRFVDMWGIPAEVIAAKSEEQAFAWALRNKVADPGAIASQMEDALAHPDERRRQEVTLKDGRVYEVHRSPMTRPDGGYMGRVWFFRDITDRKEAERALRRLNRTLRTLSRGNEALVRAASEPELLRDMCRVIVETGGYRMAWVGVPQQDAAKSVTPVAWAGIGAEFFEGPPLHSWASEPEGGCACGRALNSGQSQTSQDLLKDPAMMLWRAKFARHGISATAAFPLRDSTDVFAVLTIYAAEADAFDSDELKLLEELATDLAFGIRSLREHTAREALDKRWQTSLEATVGAIANTVEMRDPYTAGHQQRVARLAVAIARELALPEHQIQGLYLAGIIHDVGKIDIPSDILNKPGKLSKLQYQLIQGHAEAGYDIVKGVDFPWPIAEMVRQHHERLDGSGYPRGLKDEAILPEAKILAVADVVEAMMSHRPYRASLGVEAALAEIEMGKGGLFDPAAVEACTALFRQARFSFE